MFRCAAARQTEIMVQNILGHGIDIHLLGLREGCKDKGEPLHELFTDESYKISQCFLLSTSQVSHSDSFDHFDSKNKIKILTSTSTFYFL